MFIIENVCTENHCAYTQDAVQIVPKSHLLRKLLLETAKLYLF